MYSTHSYTKDTYRYLIGDDEFVTPVKDDEGIHVSGNSSTI